LATNLLTTDKQRDERIRFTSVHEKFATIKPFIISVQLSDLSERNTNHNDRDSLALLKSLFSDFFSPKQLIGFRDWHGEMQVVIRTPYGDHDIDQMSSGEKEVFSILVHLFRVRNLPCVILYDEPERHLNPGLETMIIPALDKLQTHNQLWLATHAVELIGSVPMSEIIALKREAGTSIPERFTEARQTDRVRLFESVGAKVGLQLASNRIVFVEGKEAQADKQIFDRLAGPKLPGVVFVASGGSQEVIGAATHASLLIEKASEDTAFAMILDRDYKDNEAVESLRTRLHERVYVLGCHESENILIEPAIIHKVLLNNGVTTFADAQAVNRELIEVTKSMKDLFIYSWASRKLRSRAVSGEPSDNSMVGMTENDFAESMKAIKSRVEHSYSEQNITSVLDETKRAVTFCLGNGTWKNILPGKEILKQFCLKHLGTLPYDMFKSQIVSVMVDQNYEPAEITEMCVFINRL
jgi:hypothetical protein